MILVDSDVLIAHLRGIPHAKDWLRRARRDSGRLSISAVTVTEVAGGMRQRETRQVTRLLTSFDVFPVGVQVAWKASELMRNYRQSHPGIGLGDYVIAATAVTEGLQLATLNVRHFPMFPDIQAPFDISQKPQ